MISLEISDTYQSLCNTPMRILIVQHGPFDMKRMLNEIGQNVYFENKRTSNFIFITNSISLGFQTL